MDIFAPIETPRLTLRCIERADAAKTSALMTEAVSAWLASWPMPFTPDMAKRRIAQEREAARQGNVLPCAIVIKNTGAFAGWISLTRCENDARRGTLGYWLGETFQGQGFAREALGGLLQVAFGLLTLEVIEAGAQPDNPGSFAVMRNCGMTESGSRMVHAPSRGRDELCIFYEIKKP